MRLIDKSAVIAEIKKLRKRARELYGCSQFNTAYDNVLESIDTIETKEVDFERELSYYVSNGIHRFFPNVDDDYCKMESFIWQDYVIETAKHFFELGLKTKKGE